MSGVRRGLTLIVAAGLALAGAAWGTCAWADSLQGMIDAAKAGDTIQPPAGAYTEHLKITKPITLDGSKGVVVDGGGVGTVVELSTSNATLRNLTIRNSGRLHNAIDAGIRVNGDFNIIKDVKIENALFGIDLHQSNDNVVRRTTIESKNMPLELRGDSIRLWYSQKNRIEDNTIHDARDFVVWYSHDNIITGNTIRNGRYGVHFMYAHNNIMRDNEVADCVVGVFLMYSNGVQVVHNKLLRSWGASGMGVGFKESSEVVIADNDIVGNAVGVFIDISPYDPDAVNTFTGNHVAYNGIGVEFHTDWEGDVFEHNSFDANFTQVAVRGGGTALRETWRGNYWDDYAGFDRDGDGRGDSPYQIYSYADRIWMEYRDANFFRGGLALEALDFVERLAPFTEPKLLVSEQQPLVGEPGVSQTAQKTDALEMLQ
jgi:nitrous oxidase accessory protein